MNTPAENIIEEPDENIKEVTAFDSKEDQEELKRLEARIFQIAFAKDVA